MSSHFRCRIMGREPGALGILDVGRVYLVRAINAWDARIKAIDAAYREGKIEHVQVMDVREEDRNEEEG